MSSTIIQKKADEIKKENDEKMAERERRKLARRNRKSNQQPIIEETTSVVPTSIPIAETDKQKYIKELERQIEVHTKTLQVKQEQSIQLDNKIDNLKRRQKTLIYDYNKKIETYTQKEESIINNIFNLEKKNLELTNKQRDTNLNLDKIQSDITYYTTILEEKKNTYENEIASNEESKKSLIENIRDLNNKKMKLNEDITILEEDYDNIKNGKNILINKINQLNNELETINTNISNREKVYANLQQQVEKNYEETFKNLEEQYNIKINKHRLELEQTESLLISEIKKMNDNIELRKKENQLSLAELERRYEDELTQLKTQHSKKINDFTNAHKKQQQEIENNFNRLRRELESKEEQLRSDVEQRRIRRKRKMDTILNNNSKGMQTDDVKIITIDITEREIQVGSSLFDLTEHEIQCNLISDLEKELIMKQQLLNNRHLSFSSDDGSLKSLSLTPVPELLIYEDEAEKDSRNEIPETFENVPAIFDELYKEEMQKMNTKEYNREIVLNKLYELKQEQVNKHKEPVFVPQLAPKKEVIKQKVVDVEPHELEELDLGIIDYFNNELNKNIRVVDTNKIRIKKKDISHVSTPNIEITSIFYYSVNYKFYDNNQNTFNIFYNYDKDKTNLFHLNLFTNDGGIKKMIELKLSTEYKIRVKIENNMLCVLFNDTEIYNKKFPYIFKYIESNTNYYIKKFL